VLDFPVRWGRNRHTPSLTCGFARLTYLLLKSDGYLAHHLYRVEKMHLRVRCCKSPSDAGLPQLPGRYTWSGRVVPTGRELTVCLFTVKPVYAEAIHRNRGRPL
jgi:hypothetical protein